MKLPKGKGALGTPGEKKGRGSYFLAVHNQSEWVEKKAGDHPAPPVRAKCHPRGERVSVTPDTHSCDAINPGYLPNGDFTLVITFWSGLLRLRMSGSQKPVYRY